MEAVFGTTQMHRYPRLAATTLNPIPVLPNALNDVESEYHYHTVHGLLLKNAYLPSTRKLQYCLAKSCLSSLQITCIQVICVKAGGSYRADV